jgi:hypothetical protein
MTRREIIAALQAKGIQSVWGRGLSTRTKGELEEYLAATSATERGYARHFSHSAITEWHKCGCYYYFKRIDPKAPKFPKALKLHRGSCHHRGLEQGLEEKMQSGREPNETAMTDAYVEAFQNPAEEVDWTDADRNREESNGVNLVKLYRKVIIPQVSPTAVEDKYSVVFSNRPWTFMVITDMEATTENGVEVVVDHKVGVKSPASDEAEVSEQLTAYAMAFQAKTGRIPIVRIDRAISWRGTPQKKTVERFSAIQDTPHGMVGIVSITSTRTQEQINHYLRVFLQSAADGISKGVFSPPWSDFAWWCRPASCDYWSYCHQPQ